MSQHQLESSSDDESSQDSSEYHSGQEPESKEEQYVTIDNMFLYIWFSLPAFFPNAHKQLQGRPQPPYICAIDLVDTKNALAYINEHFSPNQVS